MDLTLPGEQRFVAEGNLEFTHGITNQFFVDGAAGALAGFEQFFDQIGQDLMGDSLKQQLFLGMGSGAHEITIEFTTWQGDTREWGGFGSDASPTTKLQALNRALSTTRITSDSPATLEIGEYSSSGSYNPLPVVVKESTLTFSSREQASSFDGHIQFIESADVSDPIDAIQNPGS